MTTFQMKSWSFHPSVGSSNLGESQKVLILVKILEAQNHFLSAALRASSFRQKVSMRRGGFEKSPPFFSSSNIRLLYLQPKISCFKKMQFGQPSPKLFARSWRRKKFLKEMFFSWEELCKWNVECLFDSCVKFFRWKSKTDYY